MSVNQTNKSTDKLKKALQSGKSALREIINDVGGGITDSTPYADYATKFKAHKISKYVEDAVKDKVDKVQGKGLSENDFTDTLKSKLDNIEANAEVNALEGIQVDGTDLTPDASKKVNVVISGKVDKTSSSDKVYGTDSSGNQKTFDIENAPGGDGVIVRRSAQTGHIGQIIVPLTPINNEEASSKKYVDDLIATVKRDSYILVNTTTYPTLNDFLATIGEDGEMYLYPLDTSDVSKGYYRYIYENSSWINIGTTEIDLSNYYTKSQVDTAIANAKEIFVATYGTTTYSEITNALNDGKLPICFYNNIEYVYVGLSSTNRYTFSSQLFDTNRYVSVNSSDSWGIGSNNLEVVNNKVTSISSSSTNTQYPSAKCVYDYAQPIIDSSHKLNADSVDDTSTTNKFVTLTEKNTWNSKIENYEVITQVNALPTATETSPDFVEYDKCLYKKVLSFSLEGTTWYFHSLIEYSGSISFDINFITDGGNETMIINNSEAIYYSDAYEAYYYGSGYGSGWVKEAYRTILITGGNDVESQVLEEWLEINADHIGGNPYSYRYIAIDANELPSIKYNANKVLKVNNTGTAVVWDTDNGMINPMTARGDIIVGGNSGTPTRLAKGTAGQVLTMNSGATAPEWSSLPTELFPVTYGTTTYSQITTALSAGKLPICDYGYHLYIYNSKNTTSNYYAFTNISGNYEQHIRVNTANEWSGSGVTMEVTSNKVTSLSSGSTDTQYPSAKCVYDQLALKTDTWRKIKVNGVDKLGTATNTNALDLVAGTNITISENNGVVTISYSGGEQTSFNLIVCQTANETPDVATISVGGSTISGTLAPSALTVGTLYLCNDATNPATNDIYTEYITAKKLVTTSETMLVEESDENVNVSTQGYMYDVHISVDTSNMSNVTCDIQYEALQVVPDYIILILSAQQYAVFQSSGVTFTYDESSYTYVWEKFGTTPTGVTAGVTSVALSVPTGLSVSGSPITSSGTLVITLASGYAIPQVDANGCITTPLSYLTTAPVADNTGGGVIKVYLPESVESTTTRYEGYEYNFYKVTE